MATIVAPRQSSSKWRSRAVLRLIEPGSLVDCKHCGQRVKFQARLRLQQVICNVYIDDKWIRVEHFHADCYEEAEQPYGVPELDERRSYGNGNGNGNGNSANSGTSTAPSAAASATPAAAATPA
jgi:hypothetical protein